ncbi:hypothetical protein [Streptomyces sp. TBY4]|uniref:hypothetical protein n=1 Tax=Streptomyces sp. TBY4 TaxID=2962030 RepID=UPI0020B7D60E|nr:hypothetical protein [Streptomyces sp. TBY4]MCP3758898.1 hypothetical protein [Streptomyces sp. TBY4]
MWWKRLESTTGDPLKKLVARLSIPTPFDLEAFCEAVAEDRGRPLFLQQLDDSNPDLPCGLWMSLDAFDLVFYQPAASAILRRQIVLHEISHMLLGHVGPHFDTLSGPEGDGELPAGFPANPFAAHTEKFGRSEPDLPVSEFMRAHAARVRAQLAKTTAEDEELGISPSAMAALLGRTKYSGPQESDAETLATLIHEKASRTEARSRTTEGADVLERLSDAFGHPTQ